MRGDGPENAEVMVIGEAPGKQEDDKGRPFVGKSGELLNQLLKENGLDRRKIYVTNVVKCRPPGNRTPTANEMKACKPYLDAEFDRIKPKFVLLLGAPALKVVTRKSGITNLRGQVLPPSGIQGSFFEVEVPKVMATFHPAAALRDPARHPPLVKDVEKFSLLVRDELPKEEKLSYRRIVDRESWRAFLADFERCEAFSFDVETTGLDRHMENGAINSIQFGLEIDERIETWVLPLEIRSEPGWENPFRGAYSLQKRMLAVIVRLSREKKAVAQNGKFDNLWLRKIYGLSFELYFDTMLAHHTLDENSSHDLKTMVIEEGGPNYDIPLKDKLGRGNLKVFYDYGAADGYWELKLYQLLRKKLVAERSLRRLFSRLVMRSARAFEDIEENGLWLDLDRLQATREKLQTKLTAIKKDLDEYARKVTKRKVNWDSPDQVADLLFRRMKLPVIEETDGGKPSTAETVLLRLDAPIAKKLIEYRGVTKNLSTYIDGWEKLRHGNRLYLSTKLHGTVTGRYSSRLHQVPRDPEIRSNVTAPPGWKFGSADYSQIELRLVAHAADERRMKLIFQTGGDIHSTTASEVLGTDPSELTKEERKKGKPINFGFVYGMWWKKFGAYARDNYGVVFKDSESKAYRERFFEIYADLPKWHERMRRIVRLLGYVTSLSGRKRRLPGAMSTDDAIRQEAERQAINAPIQGFGSGDMKAMAIVELHEKFRDPEFVKSLRTKDGKWFTFPTDDRGRPDILRIVGEVHDSILFWVREGYEEIVLPEIKRIMERPALFEEFKIDISVPILVDIELGPWGSPTLKWENDRLVPID